MTPIENPRRTVLRTLLAVVLVAAVTAVSVITLTRGDAARTRPAAATAPAHPAGRAPVAGPPATHPATTRTAGPTPTDPARAADTVVRVSAMQTDGGVYGVGMPIVLFVTPAPKSVTAFERAVAVTVDGRPAGGAWNWSRPTADEVAAHTVEAHYRTPGYWPADSRVHVAVPIGGLSAGPGMVFGGQLTSLDFRIGDAHISTVDARDLSMTVRANGRVVRTVPVSLGEATSPTFDGTKIVMQKGEDVPGTGRRRPDGTVLMSGPGYTDDPVKWSVRVTRSGEYVHAAPWNHQLGSRSTSHGCTNLSESAARWFYGFSRVGDVVTYTHTDGSAMPSWDGLGDWNVPWTQWVRGGLLRA